MSKQTIASPYKIAIYGAILAGIMILGKNLTHIPTPAEAQGLEISQAEIVGYGEVHPVTRIDDCDLDFQQGKKTISAPQWFKDETWGGEFACHERQVLAKLAYLESTFRKDVCNARYKQYCGLFQIGNAARQECINNGKNTSDYRCALYHFNVNPNRFEAYSRNKFLFN